MALDTKDLDAIKQIISNFNDDMAVAIARSFERMQESMDAMENRHLARLVELADDIEGSRQALADLLGDVRTDVRELRADE